MAVVNRGIATALEYIRGILEKHVVSFVPFIRNKIMLTLDNILPHAAEAVYRY